MITPESLAAELNMQPYELSAFMGWDSPTTQPKGYRHGVISDSMAEEARTLVNGTL